MDTPTFLSVINPPELLEPVNHNEIQDYKYKNQECEELFENRIQIIQPPKSNRIFHLTDAVTYSAAADSILCSEYLKKIEPEGREHEEEDEFPLKTVLPEIDMNELVTEVITFFNNFIHKNVTESILQYIDNPVFTNYDQVVKRLWICSSTSALYAAYLANQENLQLFTEVLREKDASADIDTIIDSLNYIVDKTPAIVESLNYAKSAKRNEFIQLPEMPLKYDYMFVADNLMQMLIDFTGSLHPYELQNIFFSYYDIIFEVIDQYSIISVTDLLIEFRVELKDKIEQGSYVLIMHIINLFVVYGNFVFQDEVVISLEAPYINYRELEHTAFIYIDSHGLIESNVETTPIFNEELTPEVSKVPDNMNLFIQKFGEPLCSIKVQKYNPGKYCTTKCISEGKKICDCSYNISSGNTVRKISEELDDILENNKFPSLFYLYSKRNTDFKQRGLTQYIYEDSAPITRTEIRENMPVRNIARITTRVTEYLNKSYSIELSDIIGKGVYNIITGELINSNPTFVEYMRHRYHRRFASMFDVVRSFNVDNYDVTRNHTTSCVYIKKYYLSDIIGYFHSLNYKNIVIIDDSCDSYDPAEPDRFMSDRSLSPEIRQQMKEKADLAIKEVGDYGLGIRKLNKYKKSKKYSKKIKKSKNANKSSRKKQKRSHPTKRTRKIYFKSI